MQPVLFAGTRKGLFVLRGDESRGKWEVEGPLLPGWEVFHAIRDPRDGVLYTATNNPVYGASVHRSDDLGQTWERSEGLALPEGSDLTLERTWHVEPGHDSTPGTLWLGGAPGVLFRTDGGAETWQVVNGIFEHPTRDQWNPGAGGLCCHSIQVDPDEPQRLYVGISAAGVFRTDDGGETWQPANKGTAADFMPDKYPEVGQCVHKLLLHPARPERLWQQNHCGVYRSDDRGESWERLDGNGLPSGFGFPIALEPGDPDVAYVVPEEGAENRVTCDGRLGVYRTEDAGASWELHAAGLPEPAWIAVMREGLTFDEAGVYLGTQSGSVFVLADGTWTEAARQLPPVLSVEVSEWS
ncbi:MAG: exo-alpha-sialidase [Actinomycetota bacterium]|nr:exo-alpha-sialidase [Actinomycetota bacterium]